MRPQSRNQSPEHFFKKTFKTFYHWYLEYIPKDIYCFKRAKKGKTVRFLFLSKVTGRQESLASLYHISKMHISVL